jgi:hypothetical protein
MREGDEQRKVHSDEVSVMCMAQMKERESIQPVLIKQIKTEPKWCVGSSRGRETVANTLSTAINIPHQCTANK